MFSARKLRGLSVSLVAALAVLPVATAPAARAQAPATRYLGSITAINGDTLTVKTDAGDEHQVQVPSTAQLKRVEPGQTDLTKAQPLEFSSLAAGDRVLVNLDPNVTSGTPQAARIIAIKHADVAKMQQTEIEAWNQGVHGLVKSVDPATGAIVVSMRVGTATKDVNVNTDKATVLKRYASGSVRFDQAEPSTIGTIKVGDQLWARGTKSEDGASMAAQGIVSGSFRSIPGTILSVDTTASAVTVKDLATKKPVTIHITPDSQLRQLDPNMATMLAARLKGGGGGPGGRGAYGGGQGGGPGGGAGTRRGFSQAGGGPGGAPGRMDLETTLERAPEIQIAALKKGDAVMIVATEDTSGMNAIKLLDGVEPLLEAPEAQNLLSSWSLDQGTPDTGQ
jgi:ribosomal protein L21E